MKNKSSIKLCNFYLPWWWSKKYFRSSEMLLCSMWKNFGDLNWRGFFIWTYSIQILNIFLTRIYITVFESILCLLLCPWWWIKNTFVLPRYSMRKILETWTEEAFMCRVDIVPKYLLSFYLIYSIKLFCWGLKVLLFFQDAEH